MEKLNFFDKKKRLLDPEVCSNLSIAQGKGDFQEEAKLLPKLYSKFRGSQNDGKSIIDRFFEKIAFGTSDCWLWIGNIGACNYGIFSALSERRAHRVAWKLFYGPIPKGLNVLHKCDVRSCVNPDHLFLGTQADNVKDMVDKQRHKSPCPRYGEENPVSKLTRKQVDEIRSIRGKYFQNKIAKMFDVSPMTISRIMNNKLWRKEDENE